MLQKGKIPGGAQNSRIVEEECKQTNEILTKSVCKQHFLQGEKRRELSASDKLEATKSVFFHIIIS